jgi:hypothetical protein
VSAVTRSERLALVAIALAFLVLATMYNVVSPVFEAPDEHTHYFFAQHLALTHSLPVQPANEDERGPWEQEGSQPPLYYLLAAPLVGLTGAQLTAEDLWYNHQNTMGYPALVGNENRFVHDPSTEGWPWRGHALAVHLVRGLSTLLGLLTVLLVWYIARRVLPARPWLALASAAAVAFLPQFTYLSASLTNDVLVVALSTGVLALLLRVAEGNDDVPTILALAVAVGLAPLAKLSGLAVLGFALLTLAWLSWRRRDARLFVRTAGAVLVATLAISGWWYLRNAQLYGDVTGISHMLPAGTRRAFSLQRWLRGLPGELVGMWYSMWALFGWFTIMAPRWVYGAVTLASLAALAGLALAGYRRDAWIDWRRLAWLGAWLAVVLVSLLRWMTIAKGAHGRLLFPAIAALSVGLVTGWRAVTPGRVSDRGFSAAVSGLFLAFCLFALLGVLRPAYSGLARTTAGDIPADAVSADVLFGDALRLLAARLPQSVREGEALPVTLYWQVATTPERDGFVTLRIDQTVMTVDQSAPDGLASRTIPGTPDHSYLGRGAVPPSLLEAGSDVYVDRRTTTAPMLGSAPMTGGLEGTQPQRGLGGVDGRSPDCEPPLPLEGRFSVHIYDPASEEAWPAISASDGSAVPDWSHHIVLLPRDPLAPPPPDLVDATRLASFANGIELLALEARRCDDDSEAQWRPSDRSTPPDATTGGFEYVDATWLTTAPLEADLTTFVHVVDGEGELVTAYDRPPATHGPLRTSLWQAGQVVPAHLPWRPPAAGTLEGQSDDENAGYSVLIGLYDAGDGSRVAAYRPDGTRWPNDAVVWLSVGVSPRSTHDAGQ